MFNIPEPDYTEELNNKFWLDKAVKFDLGVCLIYGRPVIIEKGLYANKDLWFLKMEYEKGWFLGKDGLWYYEELLNQGMPPDDAYKFLTNILWTSALEVYDFWKIVIKEGKKPLYVK